VIPALQFTAVAAQTVLVPELRSAVRNLTSEQSAKALYSEGRTNLATKVRSQCRLCFTPALAPVPMAAWCQGGHISSMLQSGDTVRGLVSAQGSRDALMGVLAVGWICSSGAVKISGCMQVKEQLNEQLLDRGVTIEQVLLRSITFPVRRRRQPIPQPSPMALLQLRAAALEKLNLTWLAGHGWLPRLTKSEMTIVFLVTWTTTHHCEMLPRFSASCVRLVCRISCRMQSRRS
jgi:hypothetical protein